MAVRGVPIAIGSHQAIHYNPDKIIGISASILCPLTHAYHHPEQVHHRKIVKNFLLLCLFAFFAHNLGVKRALSVY
jgi:hypothetical protein